MVWHAMHTMNLPILPVMGLNLRWSSPLLEGHGAVVLRGAMWRGEQGGGHERKRLLGTHACAHAQERVEREGWWMGQVNSFTFAVRLTTS